MRYRSTRSTRDGGLKGFLEAVLQGLAPDGGLYVPESTPRVEPERLEKWRDGSFVDVACHVFREFVEPAEIGDGPLRALLEKSFASFDCASVAPLVPLEAAGPDMLLLELFHGPTFAFKDVALQVVGNLFEYALAANAAAAREPRALAVLGATSGDTGSAALYGVRGRQNLSAVILFPQGRVSPVQEAQMTTLGDSNVHCLALEGTFDTCQDIVKQCFGDADFCKRLGAPGTQLGAVNSINWARILAQICYYVHGYFALLQRLGVPADAPAAEWPAVTFAVPTGNFGDVLAGFYARRLGLPIRRLVVATNSNDILCRFFESGTYAKGGQHALATASPAMDILVSSNFERLLWHTLVDGGDAPADAGKTVCAWMAHLAAENAFSVPAAVLKRLAKVFAAHRATDDTTLATIAHLYRDPAHSMLVDPHTAVGVAAARALAVPGEPCVVLATAHPGKFPETIQRALPGVYSSGNDFAPAAIRALAGLSRRVIVVRRSSSLSLLAQVQQVVLRVLQAEEGGDIAGVLEGIPGVCVECG